MTGQSRYREHCNLCNLLLPVPLFRKEHSSHVSAGCEKSCLKMTEVSMYRVGVMST